MQRNKPVKVLFLVRGGVRRGLAPSARFRVYAYEKYFKSDQRFKVKIRPSMPPANFYEHIFFKKYKFLAGFLVPAGFCLMFLTRLAHVVLCLFYDVIILQRTFFPGKTKPFLELFICFLKKNVIFDFDDAIFVYHKNNSAERQNWIYKILEDDKNVEKIITKCHAVLAGNKYLAEYAQRFNPRTTIVPTPVDADYYKPLPAKVVKNPPVVTIGWIGTSGNLPYVEDLTGSFCKLQAEYNCVFKIVCNPVARRLRMDGLHYEWLNWSIENELQDILSFDIGIMPLEDTPWTRGKCGFKLLQYMACGIPVVASPVGVNREIIQDNINGFTARTLDEWTEKLTRLINDQELRKRFGARGREMVLSQYSLERNYPLLADAILESSCEDGCIRFIHGA